MESTKPEQQLDQHLPVRAGGTIGIPSEDRRSWSPETARLWNRFFAKCVRTEGGCLIYGGARDRHGYAAVWFGGTMRQGHRLSWELTRGPIPDGLTLDHGCANRACVEPSHLEPCTRAENTRRGAARRRAERQAAEGSADGDHR